MHGVRRFASWSLIMTAITVLAVPALAVDPWTFGATEVTARAATRPSLATFTLELDGTPVGPLRAAEGGDLKADVVSSGVDRGYQVKHVGQVTFSDVRVVAGAGMQPAFYDWIAATMDAKTPYKNGAVVVLDSKSQVVERREFSHALLTEVTLPTLDAGSKEAAYLTVRFAPEDVKVSPGGSAAPPPTGKTQRPWNVSNFRLEIPGLDCLRVRKVESISFKQKAVDLEDGAQRRYEKIPGAMSVSDFAVTLPASSAETWRAWVKSFIELGQSDASHEKKGDLVFLAPDAKTEIARVHLSGLGIKGLARTGAGSADQIPSVVATMYCQRVALEWMAGGAPVAGK